MGLDMYLSAEKFVSGWQFRMPDGTVDAKMKDPLFDPILKLIGDVPVAAGSRNLSIEVTVAYWRKANQIHKWFVDNVQDGSDECQKQYVERSQLEALRDLVRSLLQQRENAKTPKAIEALHKRIAEELPPQSGFFFGSDEVDDYYFDDLKETDEQLTAILDNDILNADLGLGSWTFYYQSSW